MVKVNSRAERSKRRLAGAARDAGVFMLPLEARLLLSSPLTAIPALNSLPSASAKLYLDFDGDTTPNWGSFHPGTTPAFDQDGDPTTFSDSEINSIREIWARVAEKYSPFNINVTTVNPGAFPDRVALRVVVGGTGGWLGSAAGGVSYVGSFSNGSANVSFIFSGSLGNSPRYVAEAAAHEAGHAFGLQHQALWNGTTLTNEYNPGTSTTAPIMGTSYYATRGLWWNGPTPTSSTSMQDDMSIIAGSSNGFGYRHDDHGSSVATATLLTPASNKISASGVIEQTSDSDYFAFTSGSGPVSFTASPVSYGMLDAKIELRDAAGNVLASADPSGLSATVNFVLPSLGRYFVDVTSHGSYGDVGQYTLSGTVQPLVAAPQAPGGLVATAGAGQLSLAWGAVDGAASYNVYRSTSPNGEGQTPLAANVSSTSFVDTAVVAGQTYFYRVTAVNSAGESTKSDEATARVPTPPGFALENQVIEAGGSLATAVTIDESNPAQTWIATVDYGDGAGPQPLEPTADNSVVLSRQYALPGTYTLTLTVTDSLGLSSAASATVTVLPGVVAAPLAATNYTLRLDPTGVYTQFFLSDPASSQPDYSIRHDLLTEPLDFAVPQDNAMLTIDLTYGNPLPTGGLNVQVTGANDTLRIVAGPSPASVALSPGQMSVDGTAVTYSGLAGMEFLGGAGDDMLSLSGDVGFEPLFAGGDGNDTLSIDGGSHTFSSDLGDLTANLHLLAGGDAHVSLDAAQHLAELQASGQAHVVIPTSLRTVLATHLLSLSDEASLDLGQSDLVLRYTAASPESQVQQYVSNWLAGSGPMLLTSDVTGGLSQSGRTLAVFDNHDFHASAWGGEAFDPEDYNQVITKYTYLGDANGDGKVDPTDYAVVDGKIGLGHSWITGDLNFDGKVDPSDYAQIDGNQGAGLGGAGGPQLLPPQPPAPQASNRPDATTSLKGEWLPLPQPQGAAGPFSTRPIRDDGNLLALAGAVLV